MDPSLGRYLEGKGKIWPTIKREMFSPRRTRTGEGLERGILERNTPCKKPPSYKHEEIREKKEGRGRQRRIYPGAGTHKQKSTNVKT